MLIAIGNTKEPIGTSRSVSKKKAVWRNSHAAPKVNKPSTGQARSIGLPKILGTISAQDHPSLPKESLVQSSFDADIKPLDLIQPQSSQQADMELEATAVTEDENESDNVELAEAKYAMLLAKYELVYAKNKARLAAKAAIGTLAGE